MSSDIDMIDMCLVNDTVRLPQLYPNFCDFSSTKRCQSCPALNIIRFLTALLALSESPDQLRRDAAFLAWLLRLYVIARRVFTEHVTQE